MENSQGPSRRHVLALAALGTFLGANGMMTAPPAVAAQVFTSPVTPRPSWTRGYSSDHQGIDIRVSYLPVYAAAAGQVYLLGSDPAANDRANGGYMIGIDHGNGYVTRYAHLANFTVNPNDYVGQGQQIAVSGNTGLSSGAHLHYEVATDRGALNRVDPTPLTNFDYRPTFISGGFLMALNDSEQQEILALVRAIRAGQLAPGGQANWGQVHDPLIRDSRDALVKPNSQGFRPIDILTSHVQQILAKVNTLS